MFLRFTDEPSLPEHLAPLITLFADCDADGSQDFIGIDPLAILVDQFLMDQCRRSLILFDGNVLDRDFDARIIVGHHVQEHLPIRADFRQPLQC